MDNKKVSQNLPDGTAPDEEINLLKQELASGERRERRLRWAVIVSIVAAMIFLVLGGFWSGKTKEITIQSVTAQAVIQEGMQAGINEVVREQLIAEMQNTELKKQAQISLDRQLSAQARQLSAQAQLLFATNGSKRMTAVQLAIESMRLVPSAEAAQIMADNKLAYPVSQMVNGGNFVAFSPNGKYVVSVGAYEGTVRVWEVETGKEIARTVHQYGAWSAAVSPDGKYVVSGGGDGTARVWEISTGKEISRMVHGDVVHTVAFSRNGK